MKIFLWANMSGLIAATVQGTLDTADLDPELARRAVELLRPENIAGGNNDSHSQRTDPHEFELRFGEPTKTYFISERDVGVREDVLDLLHELRREIWHQQRVAPKGEENC